MFTFLVPYHIGDITAGLTILSYYLTGQHRPEIRSYPEVRLFFIFVVFSALCVPFGFYPAKGVKFLLDFGLKIGIYLWLVAKLISTQERIQGLLKTLMFSGVINALSAVLRAGTGGRIGGGGAYDPNDLALVLVTTLPITVMQGLSSASKIWKVICYLGALFSLLGLIATQSRGGFLGLIAVGGFMLVIRVPGISKKNLILTLGVLAIFFGSYIGTQYKERIETIFEETLNDVAAGSGRIGVWKQALQIARDHPMFGVGPLAFSTAHGQYLEAGKFEGELSRERLGGMWRTAHNSFLLILAEMGIPGLLIFIAINLRSFRNLRKVKTRSVGIEATRLLNIQATSLMMALFGFLVCAFFLSQSYHVTSYLFCFLSGAMVRTFEASQNNNT